MRADEILGKTVLVGLTYVTADGRVRDREQWHGVVVSFDEDHGVEVQTPSGEIRTLPPTLDGFEPAEPGEYTLRDTGTVVSDPDLIATWRITDPDDDSVRTDEEWIDRYGDHRSLYDAFAERLEDLVETLLDEREIDYAWALPFSVTPSELGRDLNEARRNGDDIDSPLDGQLLLAGVRVGLAAPTDLHEIEELIEDEFSVDAASSLSVDSAAERNQRLRTPASAETFTYEFPYYVVEIDERRAELAEWSRYAGLKVRIELTTLLQDAWEDVLEDLPFRAATSYPSEVRTLLARSAASLLAADADAASASETFFRLLAEYQEAVAAGSLDLPLNGASLLAYIQVSELVVSLAELGHAAGLRYDPDDSPDWDDIKDATWLLGRDGLQTVAALDEFLTKALPRATDTLARFADLCTKSGYTPWALRESVVEFLWLILNRADAETVSFMRYRAEIRDALDTLIGNHSAPDSDL